MTATEPGPPRSVPVGAILLLVLAGGLYIWMMINITGPSGGGGEASLERALEALFLTVFLWGVLAMLLIVGGVMGEMPRRAAIVAAIVHPLSGFAAFVAIDMVSRHAVWALLVPGLLPPLIAFYAMWARCPSLRRVLPPEITSIAVWGMILFLTIAPFPIAYWGPGTFGR